MVVLEPLNPRKVRDYLLNRLRPDDTRWRPLLDFLTDPPESHPLAAALTTPLSLGLIQRTYAAPQTSPIELRFATAGAIERHLMETALVRAASGAGANARGPKNRAVPWLRFLAAHLTVLDTVDLAR